jgi:hypothetical protein
MVARHSFTSATGTTWQMPVVPEIFDRTIALTPAECDALAVYATRHAVRRNGRALQAVKQALTRFERPLWAVAALRPAPRDHVAGARLALYGTMLRSGRAFWGWTMAEWLDLLGPSPAAFRAAYGNAATLGRMTLCDLAYLLGGVTDLRPAGVSRQATRTAKAIFGAVPVTAATRVTTALRQLGFRDSAGQHWLVAETPVPGATAPPLAVPGGPVRGHAHAGRPAGRRSAGEPGGRGGATPRVGARCPRPAVLAGTVATAGRGR